MTLENRIESARIIVDAITEEMDNIENALADSPPADAERRLLALRELARKLEARIAPF